MYKLIFSPQALDSYNYFVKKEVVIVRKINNLIKDIMESPFSGIGKPEPLKYELSGCWSRRISQQHRLVYKVVDDELHIISCQFHYQ